MADPTKPDDDLMRTARAYLAGMAGAAPSDGLLDETVQQATSRRTRLSMTAVLATGAVALATVGAVVAVLAFHAPPLAGGPAGPTRAAVTPGSVTATPSPATASPSPTATLVVPASPSPAAVNVCQANPSPATAADVVVDQPTAFAQLTTPLVVSGRINAFEATFRIALKDATGHDIVAQAGHSQQGQTLSPFSERVSFAVPAPTPACLWVFQYSARDGSAVKIAQVPVTLAP